MNLRNKILFLTLGLIVLLGAAVIFFLQTSFSARLIEDMKQRGIMLAGHWADMSAPDLITEKHVRLQMMINELQRQNDSLHYVYITNSEGNVIVHTFEDGFPSDLLAIHEQGFIDGHHMQHLKDGEVDIYDISVPILKGQAGILHAGFTEKEIREQVNSIINLLLTVIITVFVLGGGIAVFVAFIISRPVRELVDTARGVGHGDLSKRVKITTKDEIGQLGSAFNEMADDLSKLLVSKNYLDSLIKSIGNILIVTDRNGQIKTANETALDVLGYSGEEFIGTEFIKYWVMSNNKVLSFRDLMKDLLEDGCEMSFESRLYAKSGKEIPVFISSSIIIDMERSENEVIITAQDITKLKQTESDLKMNREQLKLERNDLRSTLDIFANVIREVEIQRGFDTYLYKPIENKSIPVCWELKSCTFKECPVYGKRNVRCWQIAGTHCGGKVQGKFAMKFGQCEKCNVYHASTHNSKHEMIETFNNMMFILQSVNRDLHESRQDAEESSRLKSEFLANMSHEIRTPMNAIIGMTALTLDSTLTEEQREYMTTVQKSSHSLLNIINDILDISKIEAGKLLIDDIDIDVRSNVEGVAYELAVQIENKDLEVMCSIAPDVPANLIGDPSRIRQVLVNLGGNAVKFTRKGEVVIRVSLKEESDKDVVVEYSVTDTGIGIDKEMQDIIFNEFIQVDGSSTRIYGGTGLGLAISKKLVELMNGDIGLESEHGKGSRFWFTLTLRKPDVLIAEHHDAELKGIKILVVDDSENHRGIIAAMLEDFRCDVLTAESGEDALKILKQAASTGAPFDIALIDMVMPGMGGQRTGSGINENSGISSTKVIVMEPFGWQESAHFKYKGCSGYLTKPVKQLVLKDTIKSVLCEKKNMTNEKRSVVHSKELIQKVPGGSVILLVEDNPVNQRMASTILKKAGYAVDLADNGLMAVEAVDKKNYSLILMDIQMPEMDGYEATRTIRTKEGYRRHTPIIAMTAHAMHGDREKCIDAGMDDYLSKPIEPHIMFETIEKWLHHAMTEKSNELGNTVSKTAETPLDVPVNMESAMNRFGNDIVFFKDMVREFLGYVQGQIRAIEDAAKSGDLELLSNNAHSIKGAAGSLSAERVYSLALALENKEEKLEVENIEILINDLKTEISSLDQFVEELPLKKEG